MIQILPWLAKRKSVNILLPKTTLVKEFKLVYFTFRLYFYYIIQYEGTNF